MREAHLRERVPAEHRVDSFGKLGAARLVDAACVVPDPLIPMLFREDTGLADLRGRKISRVFGGGLAVRGEVLRIFERLLMFTPGMG